MGDRSIIAEDCKALWSWTSFNIRRVYKWQNLIIYIIIIIIAHNLYGAHAKQVQLQSAYEMVPVINRVMEAGGTVGVKNGWAAMYK